MAATGFIYHPRCLDHDQGAGHAERPERASAIRAHLERTGLLAELDAREPRRAAPAELARVHAPAYVALVERAAAAAPVRLDPDTAVSHGSFDAALLAAGAALEAVDRVMSGEWRNAFVCARPPGHHAERAAAMGFCLFNNAALAALHLRAQHGLERVAILDWDAHHGNGTQHAFEDDPQVFYGSLHQWPFYPGTGAADERGSGAGEGATLNLPLAAGTGDVEWLGAFEREMLPALADFRPDFVLVSAGFDAHRADPLSGTRLSTGAYGELTRGVLALARAHCGGRVVSLLEGGYDLTALAESVHVHVAELRADAASSAPLAGAEVR